MLTCLNIYLLLVIKITLFLFKNYLTFPDFEHMSPLGKSDHCCLTFDFNCYVNIKESLKIARLYDRGNYQDFKYDLDQYDHRGLLR
jgi:hypothetical protein